jgi:hypothetical protein
MLDTCMTAAANTWACCCCLWHACTWVLQQPRPVAVHEGQLLLLLLLERVWWGRCRWGRREGGICPGLHELVGLVWARRPRRPMEGCAQGAHRHRAPTREPAVICGEAGRQAGRQGGQRGVSPTL